MRILHVIAWLAPRYGGPAILVPQACLAIAERGHHAEIVTTNVDGDGVLAVPTGRLSTWAGAPATFHTVSIPRRYGTSWTMLGDLRARVASFDIVHIHGLYRFHGIAAAATARSRGVPYVIQAHGSLDPWHRNHKRRAKGLYHALLEDPVIGGAGALLCTSRHEQRSIRGLGYTVPTEVIPVGIDARELRRTGSADILEARRIPADAQIVSHLGRISVKKGVPLLVDAFRRVAGAFPRAHLVIAGPDDEGIGKGLIPQIEEAGLGARITFLGVVDTEQKATLLRRSEVFVLASSDESFGVAVAEAMAVGCPVVVTSGVAIQDAIDAAGAGLIADRHPLGIADAIAAILGDPARGTAMGEAGRRLVDDQFSWSRVAVQTEALYQSILSASSSTASKWATGTGRARPRSGSVQPLFAVVSCPKCRSTVWRDQPSNRWPCASCGWTGTSVDGIPILVAQPKIAEHDEVDHAHKDAQVAHFDRPAEEQFETDRPRGTPRLYRFLLAEKFRRAVGPLRPHLDGASVLIVCGGSGMDAEKLARLGADVTTSDLSLGAAQRAATRSSRFGIGFDSVVADVEDLLVPDRSVDVVAVHDGLHHLQDPFRGLSEMARVARRWVIVSEPAHASITQFAVRLGLALEIEAAGNRVARLDPQDVADFLRARGYSVLKAERYVMYYPHHPGAAFKVLSLPLIFPTVRASWRIANAILGKFGNKMVVVAARDP